MPFLDVFVGGENFSNALQFPSSTRLSFFAIHLGLQSFESAIFYQLIQNMLQSLGGGFV